MGFFDSKTTTNKSEQANNLADNRVISGDGNIGGNVNLQAAGDINGNTISVTDFGAIDAALGFAENSIGVIGGTLDSILDFGATIVKNNGNISNNALDRTADVVKDANTDDASKNIRTLIMGMALVGALFMLRNKKL